jgi:hypothetical protein
MKLFWLIAAAAVVPMGSPATAQAPASSWDQPAETLAGQIAVILGPGQARLTIRNLSSISVDEIPAIRRLLEQDLKAHGIQASGAESANTLRITLSENVRERLWVAEVVQGSETRVTMVHVEPEIDHPSKLEAGLMLRKELMSFALSWPTALQRTEPVLAVLERENDLVILSQDSILLFDRTAIGWKERKEFDLGPRRTLTRDPRGVLVPSADGFGFMAYTSGVECVGSYAPGSDPSTHPEEGWSVRCHPSDDPWPILQPVAASGETSAAPVFKAFYNAARSYFTGVVTPNPGLDLPPFYSAAALPRPGGAALMLNGIDGKVQLAEAGALTPVSGARDWGSDFAVLQSGCGTGTQIVASGSGEALSDSLRAYEVPALEAVPVSPPLALEGTVMALQTAPGGKSLFAIVRTPAGEYEVDRVTATCN